MSFPANIELASLDGTIGFRLSGVAAGDQSGRSVASAGDVNGDGFADLMIGATSAEAGYIVFGKASGFAANVDLSSLDGSNGFKLSGSTPIHLVGFSVASAGDVNGDGFADVMVGAASTAYVVFGKESGFTANVDLSNLNSDTGFRLNMRGSLVASAGDVNGDGFADMITEGNAVVFGTASEMPPNTDRSSLNGSNGFTLSGMDNGSTSAASAGDVNGDGFADLIIGAEFANAPGEVSGTSYVVFGKESGFAANIDVSSLDGSNGFQMRGGKRLDHVGSSVASAGDVNGDGFADVIVGARGADPHGDSSGASYVVFGKAAGFTASINLSKLDGRNGFKVSGVAQGDNSGFSVASAGDVNGDGFDDLIIGARRADPNGRETGASYVVFGKAKASRFAANIELASLDGANGFKLSGVRRDNFTGTSVASAGDLNGDGLADLIVGAPQRHATQDRGESYVIYGRGPDTAVVRVGTVASQTLVGGAFDDSLSGLGGDDTLFGNGGVDILKGGDGDDVLDGGAGNDTLIGNAGSDTVRYTSAGAGVTTSLALTVAQDTGGAGVDRLQGIENAIGSAFDDVLGGSDLDNRLEGFAGNDELRGGDGNDRLEGGNGDDMFLGGLGDDRLEGGDGNDHLNGGTGADVMVGGAGNDSYTVDDALDVVEEVSGEGTDTISTSVSLTLMADRSIEVLTGRGAADLTLTGNLFSFSISGSIGNDTLDGSMRSSTLSGNDGNDTLLGGIGNNMLLGGSGNDRLEGGVGDDELDGGAGTDAMDGGDGNDTYVVDAVSDVVVETGTGYDRISTSVSVTLTATQAIDFLDGRGVANLTLNGNQLANRVWGSAGDDTVAGAGGDDNLRGKGGADTLFGGTGDDTMEGGDGADRFTYRLGDGNDSFTDFDGAGGDQVALINVTVSRLVANIAALSDGSILTAQTSYAWAASDFMPG